MGYFSPGLNTSFYKLIPWSLLLPDSLWQGVWSSHENLAGFTSSSVPYVPQNAPSTYCAKAKEHYRKRMSMLSRSFPLSQFTSSHFCSSSSLPCPMGTASKQLCRCLAAGQGQCTTRGEAVLGCGSGAGEGRCHTGKLSSSASDSSRVRQESEMQCPCHNSCIIKNTMHRQTTDPGYSPGETHLQENSKTTWFKQTFQCHAEHQHTRSYLEQRSFWESQTNWTSKLEIQEKGSRKRESN